MGEQHVQVYDRLTKVVGVQTLRQFFSASALESLMLYLRAFSPTGAPSVIFRIFANHKAATFTNAARDASWKQEGTDVTYTAAAGPDKFLIDDWPFVGVELVGSVVATDLSFDIALLGKRAFNG